MEYSSLQTCIGTMEIHVPYGITVLPATHQLRLVLNLATSEGSSLS